MGPGTYCAAFFLAGVIEAEEWMTDSTQLTISSKWRLSNVKVTCVSRLRQYFRWKMSRKSRCPQFSVSVDQWISHQCWELNPEPQACWANALPLSYAHHSIGWFWLCISGELLVILIYFILVYMKEALDKKVLNSNWGLKNILLK